MGNDINYTSNSEKAEKNKKEYEERSKKLTDKDLEEMNNSPWFDSDEMATAYKYRYQPYKEYKHYEKIDESFKEVKAKFDQINLRDFQKDDGTYNIYKLERPLKGKDSKIGNILNKTVNKLHHEGVAIGNGKNYIVFDYGKKGGNLDFAFKITKDLNEWKEIKLVGESSKNEKELLEIFFGKESEHKYSDGRDYKFITHNCQDYAKEHIKKLQN